MIGNGAGILEPLGLDQNHLELGGGMDVDHLVLLAGALGRLFVLFVHPDANAAVVVHHLGAVIDVLVLVLVPFAHQALLNAIQQRHNYLLLSFGQRPAAWRSLQKECK